MTERAVISEARVHLERELNKSFKRVFASTEGEAVLRYLKNTTINAVCGPEVTTDQLRHIEGQRFIVAHIVARIEAASKGASDAVA